MIHPSVNQGRRKSETTDKKLHNLLQTMFLITDQLQRGIWRHQKTVKDGDIFVLIKMARMRAIKHTICHCQALSCMVQLSVLWKKL